MKKTVLFLLITSLTLSGCVAVDTSEKDEEVQKLLLLIDQQQKTIEDLNAQLKTPNQNELFPVFGLDRNAENETIHFYVHLPSNLVLEERIKLLADQLSSYQFSGLPLEVLKIEEQDGHQIATLNLKELASDGQPSWARGYFQGSAGGHATTVTLTKTFLQPDYEGEWIDGVEFYYDGEPMGQWDHIDLEGVKMRN